MFEKKNDLYGLEKKDLLAMYRLMVLVREFEIRVAKINARKHIPENPHLCVGQEAIGVGACYKLRQKDHIMPSLRSRAAILTKGIPSKVLMAGIYGKTTGPSKGKHTSHHMGDVGKGILASSLLIGSQIPIAVGAALSFKYQNKDNVCLCFFGDGASNRGDFHESLNLAAIFSLPIIFICENNFYAIDTRIENSMLIKDIAIRASGYGMPGETIDGNNVLEVHHTVKKAISRAKSGKGPSLIECKTYRIRSHSERFKEERPKKEMEYWLKRCPIKNYRELLLRKKIIDEQEERTIEKSVKKNIDNAVKFAEESSYPSADEIFEDIYTTGFIKDGRLCMK